MANKPHKDKAKGFSLLHFILRHIYFYYHWHLLLSGLLLPPTLWVIVYVQPSLWVSLSIVLFQGVYWFVIVNIGRCRNGRGCSYAWKAIGRGYSFVLGKLKYWTGKRSQEEENSVGPFVNRTSGGNASVVEREIGSEVHLGAQKIGIEEPVRDVRSPLQQRKERSVHTGQYRSDYMIARGKLRPEEESLLDQGYLQRELTRARQERDPRLEKVLKDEVQRRRWNEEGKQQEAEEQQPGTKMRQRRQMPREKLLQEDDIWQRWEGGRKQWEAKIQQRKEAFIQRQRTKPAPNRNSRKYRADKYIASNSNSKESIMDTVSGVGKRPLSEILRRRTDSPSSPLRVNAVTELAIDPHEAEYGPNPVIFRHLVEHQTPSEPDEASPSHLTPNMMSEILENPHRDFVEPETSEAQESPRWMFPDAIRTDGEERSYNANMTTWSLHDPPVRPTIGSDTLGTHHPVNLDTSSSASLVARPLVARHENYVWDDRTLPLGSLSSYNTADSHMTNSFYIRNSGVGAYHEASRVTNNLARVEVPQYVSEQSSHTSETDSEDSTSHSNSSWSSLGSSDTRDEVSETATTATSDTMSDIGLQSTRSYSDEPLYDSPPNFPCSICGLTFATDAQRTIHYGRRHNRRFICSDCPKAFRLRADLARHRINVHRDRPRKEDSGSPGFFCPNDGCEVASKKWMRKDNLARHVERCRKKLGK